MRGLTLIACAILLDAVCVIQRVFASVPIVSELGPRLSPGSSIILPDSSTFAEADDRWTRWRGPNITVAVQVATEQDVQETVRYANENDLPFLAKVGGHGAIKSLAEVQNGIEIWMVGMNAISVSQDGKSATIGGGVESKDVTDTLWAAGKQTVTGGCECVGMLGPLMGGGHGFLQGQHGLLSDQLLEARMVLGNGSAVTVSKTSYPELFWAIQGAGHNFGIVTEYKTKIYDTAGRRNWAWETLTFSGDSLESVFNLHNSMLDGQPAQAVHYAVMSMNATLDPAKPIIKYNIFYQGPTSIASSYAAPFRALNPLTITSGSVEYPDLPQKAGWDLNGASCTSRIMTLRFPIDLPEFNVPSLRQMYNGFSDALSRKPAFAHSVVLIEGYSVQAVQAVPADSTAFPHREDRLLIAPMIQYSPTNTTTTTTTTDQDLSTSAFTLGQSLRSTLHAGSNRTQMHSYVNYANGYEPLEALYGEEPWRLEKLRGLKRKYDGEGRFGFYAPIS
ncbi:MAG: hypothetical protein Q9227_004261 [Pyrenula ochraceoflavens]